jgi:FkbM family methyltransferase
MSFTSYAQNFEDVMLWRALGHVEAGTYVDVGAQHPVADSVSKAFYERGWRGIHIEPVPEFAALLRHDRPDETVLQVALGAAEGTLELHVIADTGLSTAVAAHAQRHLDQQGMQARRILVPVLTVASALQALAGKEVHWLKIDVEGYEEQVLRGWDSRLLRPWVMVVEATVPGSPAIDCQAWDPILLAADYRFVYFDGLNRFYIAAEHGELAAAFSCPPNVFDEVELSGLASSTLCRGIIAKHQAELAGATAQVNQLSTQLAQGHAGLAAAKDEVGRLRAEAGLARASHLETHVVRHASELGSLAARMDEVDARVAAAEAQGQQALGQLASARDGVSHLETHVVRHAGELGALAARMGEIEARAAAAEAHASAMGQKVVDLLASSSWRITAPWRYAGGVSLRLRMALRDGTLGASVKRRAWRAARGAGQAVLRNSTAKRAARRLLGRFPRLQARLREMMYQSPVTPGAPPPSSQQPSDLSPRAQRLYAELKANKKEH